MLEPYFFQTPPSLDWQPGLIFRLLGYARVSEYTLVKWRFGGEVEYGTGETLYRDRLILASGGGVLPLYEEPQPIDPDIASGTPEVMATVWDRMDSSMGQFGVPPAIAMALRNPANYACFDPNTTFG